MRHTTAMGLNRTGMGSAPLQAAEMKQNAKANGIAPDLTTLELISERAEYIRESDVIGTVPLPTKLKGLGQTIMQKLQGQRPGVLIDKLGERLAYERSGTRMYELLLQKCAARADEAANVPIDLLKEFHDEEASHFVMIAAVMRALGADPTAQTPSADIVGISSLGLVQVLSDPRTTVPQCLQAILQAELGDNAGWKLLIRLVDGLGQDEWVTQFQAALRAEQRHLDAITQLYETTLVEEAGATKH